MPSSSEPVPLIYWDSCVFLSYLSGHDERADAIEAVIAEAMSGRYRLITSVFTIAEVAFSASERDIGALDAATLATIDGFWTPPAPVVLVELDQRIAEDARALIRGGLQSGRKRPKPADAIHLATAARMRVAQLHTYNVDDFLPWADDLGFEVANPEPAQAFLPTAENGASLTSPLDPPPGPGTRHPEGF